MIVPLTNERLVTAYETARAALLNERNADGVWTGELSASALSTATAVGALALVYRRTSAFGSFEGLIRAGIDWLARHQNEDGGWGDTVVSVSNISTSMLVRAAFHLTESVTGYPKSVERLLTYLQQRCGKTPAEQAEAIRTRYGKDRT